MKYAKLINGDIQFAPNPILVNDCYIGNPSDEIYSHNGYKPVIYTDSPHTEEGFVAVSSWEETENEIIQTWAIEQDSGEIDDSEALNIILGGSE